MTDVEERVVGNDYWIEIFREGVRLGAGFLLTRCYALTALHCLHDIVPGNDEVEISLAVGTTLHGRVHRRSPEADLALIDIPGSANGAVLPDADRADVGEPWRNPYRPSLSHAFLSGDVAAVPVTYQCEGGGAIEAMQLGCSQPLGDYAGYSGSPVERRSPEGDRTLLGILLEQYPDQYPDHERRPRASTVLFAATIAEVFRRFDCFDVNHLLNLLAPSSSEATMESPGGAPTREGRAQVAEDSHAQSPAVIPFQSRIAAADALVETFHEWQRRGLMDELSVSDLKVRVAQSLISDAMGDNA